MSTLSSPTEPAKSELAESSARTVWTLAWPAVALNSLQVINSLLDSGFIGHLPKSALIAYGGVTTIQFMLFSLAMSISTAATALVSRAYGAEKVEEFRKACRQSLTMAILAGMFFACLGASLAPMTANLFIPSQEREAAELMVKFLGIYAMGLPAIYVIQALAGSLRGVGDTKSPMVISGIQILLHIAFNFIFIFPPRHLESGITIPGFNWGLLGAAAALSGSAWASAIGYMVFTKRTALGNVLRVQMPELAWVKRIMKIAIPAAMMAVLRVASLAVFTIILKLSADGANALAAMRPGFAIESIMFMPSFGLSMAAAALVGQSLGMGKPDRAERLAWTAGHHAAIVTLVLCAPIFFFADTIANVLIVGKPEIASQTALLLRYLCVTEIGFAYAMVMIGAMQGAGDTRRPLWLTIICLWVLRVPLAFFLTLEPGQVISMGIIEWTLPVGAAMGAAGAWIAMSASQFIQGILSIVFFKQGAWKTQKV